MSKRKRTSKIENWIKEGHSSGIGQEYKPYGRDVMELGLRDLRRDHFTR
jgi:hypothetical protein